MSKLVLSVKEDMGVPQQCDEAVLKECIRGWSSSGILIQINTLILIVTSFPQRYSLFA
jgi:hypothetical protein